jgi:hypothetical protein
MIMPTHDAEQPWVPLTFSFTLNWGKDNPNLFGRVAQLFQADDEGCSPDVAGFVLLDRDPISP